MSAVSRRSSPVSVTAGRGPTTVAVRWRLSRGAAPGSARGPAPVLEVRLDRAAGTVLAVVRWEGGERTILARDRADIEFLSADGLDHWRVRVERAVVLDAVLDAGGVRFARTSLLAGLGLAGGRYEIER